jgi:hypothetical protein
MVVLCVYVRAHNTQHEGVDHARETRLRLVSESERFDTVEHIDNMALTRALLSVSAVESRRRRTL